MKGPFDVPSMMMPTAKKRRVVLELGMPVLSIVVV